MTRQRIRIVIDALTVEGGPISDRALASAIETALAERLAGAGALTPAAAAHERLHARAHPAPRDEGPEPAIGRAVADATLGALGP